MSFASTLVLFINIYRLMNLDEAILDACGRLDLPLNSPDPCLCCLCSLCFRNQWMAIDPLKVLLAAQFMAELILASEFWVLISCLLLMVSFLGYTNWFIRSLPVNHLNFEQLQAYKPGNKTWKINWFVINLGMPLEFEVVCCIFLNLKGEEKFGVTRRRKACRWHFHIACISVQ